MHSVRSQTADYLDDNSKEKGRTKQLDTVTYDTNGNESERIIYDDYGFLVGKEVHTHDAKDNLTESVLSNPKGVVMERRAYAHDNSKLVQIITYDGKGRAVLKQVNSHDALVVCVMRRTLIQRMLSGRQLMNMMRRGIFLK